MEHNVYCGLAALVESVVDLYMGFFQKVFFSASVANDMAV